MGQYIELEIISSSAAAEKIHIKEIYIPAYNGMAGILPDHLPYVGLLGFGELVYKDLNNKNHYFFVDQGFVESSDNQIKVVTDSMIDAQEIDFNKVNEELKEVKAEIKALSKKDMSPEDIEKLLRRERVLTIQKGLEEKIK